MKNILVPVDFSTVCNNAINYAVNLANGGKAQRLVLLKSFYVSIYAQLLPSADFVQLSADDVRAERGKIEGQLKQLQQNVQSLVDSSVKVDIALSESPILRAVHEGIDEVKPDLLILGSNSSELDESYIGGELITIAKSSPVPVLIIPADATYHPIKNVLVPVDLSTVQALEQLRALELAKPGKEYELLILNIDENSEQDPAAIKNAISSTLTDRSYQLYQADERNKVYAILNFAKSNALDLIVALPGKHSFFYNLTHRNMTEDLALNARQPVLILK